jgi:hypothetical protein
LDQTLREIEGTKIYVYDSKFHTESIEFPFVYEFNNDNEKNLELEEVIASEIEIPHSHEE